METLKKLFTNFKKHSKIYIAFAMIITCVFGVMFATSTFAYESDKISYTISQLSGDNFNNNIVNIDNNDNYIDVNFSDSFFVKGINNFNSNGNSYYLLINYIYLDNDNNPITNHSSTYLQVNPAIMRSNSSYISANYVRITNNQFNYNGTYYTQIIPFNYGTYYSDFINYARFNNFGGHFRIYNVDMVSSADIGLSQYYDTYYSQIESNYNELLDDFDELQDDYSQLENDYNELDSNYNSLQDDYDELQDDYNVLSAQRLPLLDAFNNCPVGLYDGANNLIVSDIVTLPAGANSININNLPLIKNYLDNYSNNTYFYLLFNLNYSINNGLLFTFNNSVLECDITISSSINNSSYTFNNQLDNQLLYQLVVNENMYSFDTLKYDGLYSPDYSDNFNLSLTIDAISYQNGLRDGLSKSNSVIKSYETLLKDYIELSSNYDNLLSNSTNSYDNGFNDGWREADESGFAESGLAQLFNCILSYPVNFIKEVFNFEFMGVNVAGFLTFLLSISIVVFVINYFRKK